MRKLIKLIQQRHSMRTLFDPGKPIARTDLASILEAARWAPTAHNMQNFEICVVDERNLIEAISKIHFPLSAAFVRENYEQLSFSEEELKRKKAGLLASTFPRFLQEPLLKSGDADREKALSFQEKTIVSCAVLLIVLYDPRKRAPASEGDFLGVMSLGCVMENMWLMAGDLGIGMRIMSVLGAGPVEKELKSKLAIPDSMKVAFGCCLGYPAVETPGYLRVRREVEDFTHYNRFNNRAANAEAFLPL
jgi:nitroreductase